MIKKLGDCARVDRSDRPPVVALDLAPFSSARNSHRVVRGPLITMNSRPRVLQLEFLKCFWRAIIFAFVVAMNRKSESQRVAESGSVALYFVGRIPTRR